MEERELDRRPFFPHLPQPGDQESGTDVERFQLAPAVEERQIGFDENGDLEAERAKARFSLPRAPSPLPVEASRALCLRNVDSEMLQSFGLGERAAKHDWENFSSRLFRCEKSKRRAAAVGRGAGRATSFEGPP